MAPANIVPLLLGLFQTSYTQENALDRDGEQMFRKFKGIKSDQYLRVPQLWAIVL